MKTTISTEEFDRFIEAGQDEVIQYFSPTAMPTVSRTNQNQIKRVNVDFPLWMVEELDKQADHLGIPRQALIKMWIAEKLSK